ncbi:hexokinase type 2-like [Sitodiplosis mosellana]|uniref:hexokinase type 2-like n=1 Tax=Sitodiplosis mosellana TaxID=263140 RepID=UPI002444B771|nr:hexokinase type 2-like [Sitodiplosis mosellana]
MKVESILISLILFFGCYSPTRAASIQNVGSKIKIASKSNLQSSEMGTKSADTNLQRIRDECQELILTDGHIQKLMKTIIQEIERGLSAETHNEADIKAFNTYVQDLPNGNERGKFLALDLGGTNFRVLLIHLNGKYEYEKTSKIYAVPQSIMLGKGEELFDHIADCLANFMKENNVYDEHLPLGFTFSFPLRQLGLTRGLLAQWTKGFACSGVVGEDVVQLLRDAIARRGDVQIDVIAILNDTTGTLMSCAWKNRRTRIGLIVGTGTNACYVEKVKNCELCDGTSKKENVIINTEWGAFGDNGALDFVRTKYDREIDEHSINRGRQIYEKMISGMYLGELVRLALVQFTKEGLLFSGQSADLLNTRDRFFTKFLSEIESDKPGSYKHCHQVMDELGLHNATDEDCQNVRYICERVSTRAAHLVSAGIAALINRIDEKSVMVAVDGSVYRFHPKFHDLMTAKIRELIKPDIEFELMLSEDGSGRGAALVAAVASRENSQQ